MSRGHRASARAAELMAAGQGDLDMEAQAAVDAAAREHGEPERTGKGRGVVRRASDAGRVLAMLTGGSRDGQWLWVDALEASQAAARRFPADHPAADLGHYVPTERREPHPTDPNETGVIYEWRD